MNLRSLIGGMKWVLLFLAFLYGNLFMPSIDFVWVASVSLVYTEIIFQAKYQRCNP